MGNRNYINGRAKEYRIMKRLRATGYLAIRSAGSHSPFDVIGIDFSNKTILLVQSKVGYLSPTEEQKIKEEGKNYEGAYNVVFELCH